MHIIYYITIAQCTLSTLGKLAFTRFQHKAVNHIYAYIYTVYIYSHVSPYFLALLHLPTCLGKGLKPFFLSFPAHLRPFSRSLLGKSMTIWMCSLLSGQVNMLKPELLQPIFFLWTIVHVILSLSFGRMTLVPFHVAGRLNLFNR